MCVKAWLQTLCYKVPFIIFLLSFIYKDQKLVTALTGVLADVLLCSFSPVSSIDSLPFKALYFCAVQNDTDSYC